jgi:hypothetical protein
MPRPSVLEPISRALDRTGRILFRPFDPGKWFALGFCAWLATLGQRAHNGGGIGRQFEGQDVRDRAVGAWEWVQAHLGLILVLGSFLVLVLLALAILLTWLSSRGKLIFVDNVVHDRAEIAGPWRRLAGLGDSLFVFRFLAGLIVFALLAGVGTLMLLNLLALGIGERELDAAGVLVVVLWSAAVGMLALAAVLLGMVINDFVVPIMWLRQCRVLAAWREFLSLLGASPGAFVLYALVKIVMAVVIGLLTCVGVCVTCCIAALPYVGVVILLPLYVFPRCYSLEFLAQLGGDYAALAGAPAERRP